MRKYTLKELKNLVKIGAASDITGFDFNQMNQFYTFTHWTRSVILPGFMVSMAV